MIYYTSDLHLGHKNIIKLCDRPFPDIETMDNEIIHNWNAVVQPQDDVYILGDFSFGAPVEKAIEYMKRLKGNKHLIIGNHDFKYLKDERFRSLLVSVDSYLEVLDGNCIVCLFHYPIAEWHGYFRERYYHIHGHIHNRDNTAGAKLIIGEPKAFNAGVDVNDFIPKTLNQLIAENISAAQSNS
ncbi:MAG: metallophosphoesterase [Oscillospiraceae bacterium]